jgi:hypothetical protein
MKHIRGQGVYKQWTVAAILSVCFGLRKSWGDVASRTVKTLAKPVSSHNRGQRVDRTPVLAASGRMMAKLFGASTTYVTRVRGAVNWLMWDHQLRSTRDAVPGKHRIEVIGTDETEMQIDVEGTEVLVECRGG